jgi:ABC-type nitrate/sulfonate/bicarbonate transport system permease component
MDYRRERSPVWSIVSVAIVLSVWYLVTEGSGLISPLTLPSPTDVVSKAKWLLSHTYNGTTLPQNLYASLSVVLIGWVLGVVVGVPLGVLIGWNGTLRQYVSPLIELFRPVPPPAWIPFAVLWFGIEPSGRVFVIFVAAVMPCIINSYGAVVGRDPILVDAARCFGASDFRILRSVIVPTIMPGILAGIRVAIGGAWMTVVAAELVASSAGLGYMLVQAQYAIQPSIVLVSMFIIGAVGGLLSITFGAIERYSRKGF